jgi:hypothetical protein
LGQASEINRAQATDGRVEVCIGAIVKDHILSKPETLPRSETVVIVELLRDKYPEFNVGTPTYRGEGM